jgi:hypothetical protein
MFTFNFRYIALLFLITSLNTAFAQNTVPVPQTEYLAQGTSSP